MLRLRNLGSGSSGNATLIEGSCGAATTRVLVDCGLGLRQLEQRLALCERHFSQLDGVFVTHEHGDHVGCLLKLMQRHPVHVWMSHGTHVGIGEPDLGDRLHLACDSESFAIGALELRPFTVPHDAREPLQLTLSDGVSRLGIATDLGHVTAHVEQHLSDCQALLLEFNHDPEMLAASNYPPFLKRRVAGRWGHLANADALDLARALWHPGVKHLVAAHLSERNNRPALVRELLHAHLTDLQDKLTVADPLSGTDWLSL